MNLLDRVMHGTRDIDVPPNVQAEPPRCGECGSELVSDSETYSLVCPVCDRSGGRTTGLSFYGDEVPSWAH